VIDDHTRKEHICQRDVGKGRLAAPNRQALAAPLGTKIAPSSPSRASGVSCTPWLDGRGGRRAAHGLGRARHRRTGRHGRAGASAATAHASATAPRAGLTGGTGSPAPGARPHGAPVHAAPRATHAGGHAHSQVQGFSLDGFVMRKNASSMVSAIFRILMPKKPLAIQKPYT